ncbi:AraC family transcriptional regulator [Kitasatospora sp. LaBMicrA B282]|uniref:AraC family transcriptional regulator n=1 Tax=Kitasatospora sp. LaBMicrA B282 TaxID=3420949 RepID=UPI003D10A3F9
MSVPRQVPSEVGSTMVGNTMVGSAALSGEMAGGSDRVLFEGSDVAGLHALVSHHFAPHRLKVLHDLPISGRYRCHHQGLVSVYELGYGAEVEVEVGELADFFNVQVPLAGQGSVTVDGVQLDSSRCIAGPGQRLSMVWSGEARNRILVIPAAAVQTALTSRLGETPAGTPRFAPVLGEDTATDAWLRIAADLAHWADAGLAGRSPLATAHLEQVLVHGLLDLQPHALPGTPDDRGGPLLPSALRRATAYCAEHAHEPISVADLARAARVSLRTLRAGFRTHLQTTPLAYLRRVRLDLAHHDLLAIADGRAEGTVTDVALRWGFTHLGRFAETYRQEYGITPSQRLRPGAAGPASAGSRSARSEP